MTLQRWDSFPDLKSLENRFARIWSRFPPLFGEGADEWSVPLDIREQDGNLVVEASVPGMKAEEIDVQIEDDILTIKGETSSEKEEKKKGYLLRERSEGSFSRTIRLPKGVDADSAESKYADGVLTVTMLKKPTTTTKKVTVNVN